MASMPRPTIRQSSRLPATADRCIGHVAVATYLGRPARRRVTRRGTCPSTLDAARRVEVAR